MKKEKGQIKHAIRRAIQRYDLDLYERDILEMVRRIQIGDIISSKKQTNRVSIVEMVVNNVRCKVAYDKQRKTIATFLPLEGMIDFDVTRVE
jgi:hypothetical protein